MSIESRRKPGGRAPARKSVEVSQSAIQHTRTNFATLARETDERFLESMTDTWVIENSLRLAAASLNRAASLNSVWHELADLIDDSDDFRDLD